MLPNERREVKMKIVLQRVKQASVEVEGKVVAQIGKGFCLLVGIEKGDSKEDGDYLARKVSELRIFPDNEGKMNLSLAEVGGEVLAVSQFTLASSVKKGRRPSFDGAEEPEKAAQLFDYFAKSIEHRGFTVKTGVFQALMDIHLVNEGPVTFFLQSEKTKM
jgi:D-tyrosyl-tRNA(Tyr) deacylase